MFRTNKWNKRRKQQTERKSREHCNLLRAIAAPMRSISTVGTSQTLEEAKKRDLDIYKQSCCALPQIMEICNNSEIIDTYELHSAISYQSRKHAGVTNPKVIDVLVFKGDEDLRSCLDHSKQQHLIIAQYVVGQEGKIPSKIGVVDNFGNFEFLNNIF